MLPWVCINVLNLFQWQRVRGLATHDHCSTSLCGSHCALTLLSGARAPPPDGRDHMRPRETVRPAVPNDGVLHGPVPLAVTNARES